MAITAIERTNIIKLVTGMFNAAPGSTYLSELVIFYEAATGTAMQKLAAMATALGNTTAYKALNPVFQTATEFASTFLTPLGLQGNQEAVDFIVAKFNAGLPKGQIAFEAIVALNNSTAPAFADARAILNNKTAVAEYFSVTKAIAQTDVTQLKLVVASVTAAASSVTEANTAVDNGNGSAGLAGSVATFTLTAGAVTVEEAGSAIFELILDKAPTADVKVNFTTKIGSASAADFEAQAGSVTFSAGQTKAFITIKTTDDAIVETNETYTIEISGTQLKAPVVVTGTIADSADIAAKAAADAAAAVKYTLTTNTVSIEEGANAVFELTLSSAPTSAVTVNYFTNPGTATTADFEAQSGTITFAAGQTKAFITVKTTDDTIVETNESFTLQLSGTQLTASVTATATIADTADIAAANAPKTFVLTTSANTIAGTTGSDIIDGGIADSFSAFDAIDGGAGTDTLTASITGITTPGGATVTNVETVNINTSGAGFTINTTTGYAGLTTLKVSDSANGDISITAANTTAVTASGLTGKMTVVGGLSQTTINAGGDLTLSESVGAIVATTTAVAGTAASINGGTSVTYTGSGITTGGSLTVGGTVAPTGAVSITATGATTAATSNTITVTGGTAVTISDVITNSTTTATATTGTVQVTGGAATTSVSVTQKATVAVATAIGAQAEIKSTAAATIGDITTAAVTAVAAIGGTAAGIVTIADKNAGSATAAATIASVTLANYGNSTISSNALSTLNLSGTAGTLGLTTGLTTPTNTTLALNVNGLSGTNTITDATAPGGLGYTTLNVTTATANSTIADIAAVDVTALNVSGTNVLTLASAAGMTTLATVAVSGAAGLNASLAQATVTSINASTSTGANTITLDSTKATYQGGSGVDKVTISAVSTKVIDGGTGTADVLVVNAASYAANTTKNIGFEVLQQGTSANGAFVATGFTSLAAGAIAGNSSFTNVAAGVGLTITGELTGGSETVQLVDDSGLSDVFNLTMSSAAAATNVVVLTGIETVNVSLVDTAAAGHVTYTQTLTITDATAKAINISGTGGVRLNLTNTSTALTSVDASGMTGAGFDFISANLTAAATIKGSVANANNVSVAAITASNLTYVGGSGEDNLILGTGANINTITLGNGTNIVTGASTGNNTVTGGTGADTFNTATTGNNTISFGDGANAFTATSGTNSYTGGSGIDTVVVGTGANTISTGAGDDSITIAGATGTGVRTTINVGTGTDTVVLTSVIQAAAANYAVLTGMAAGDKINLSAVTTSTVATTATLGAKVTLGGAATFTQYVDAAASAITVIAAGTASVFKWFQFDGNTYVVADNSANSTFTAGTDSVIQLVGLVDLAASTYTAEVLTIV